MTRWAKNASVFQIRLHESKNRDATPSIMCRIPRPIVEALGNPKALRLYVEDGRVIMEGAPDRE